MKIDKYADILHFSKKKIANLLIEGTPTQLIYLWLFNRVLLKYEEVLKMEPLLNDEQLMYLREKMGEGTMYRMYITIYKRARCFERCLDSVEAALNEAKCSLLRLKGLLNIKSTIEEAEDSINTLLDLHTPEEREKLLELLAQTAGYYHSTPKMDGEHYLAIDIADGNKETSLHDMIRIEYTKKSELFTELIGREQGFRSLLNRVRHPLTDIYKLLLDKTMAKLMDGTEEEKGKHNLTEVLSTAQRKFNYKPWMPEGVLASFKDEDYLTRKGSKDKGRVELYSDIYFEDWQYSR
jgi:hypothetical protein